jgi:hypothetical protein
MFIICHIPPPFYIVNKGNIDGTFEKKSLQVFAKYTNPKSELWVEDYKMNLMATMMALSSYES